MNLQTFEQTARSVWEQIPDGYKAGIDGLTIDQNAHAHPDHSDFFTLGECVTEAYPSDFGGPDTIRSAVVLYYGSFRALAEENTDFDWREEIHETLLHELQHHLEHLAAEDRLEDFDYAVEENFKRLDGQAFDPLFYQAGEQIDEHMYRVEDDVFVEVRTRTNDAIDYQLVWQGLELQVPIPQSDSDVLYVILGAEMPDVAGELCVVRIRERGALGTLRAAFRGRSVEEVVLELNGEAIEPE